MSNPIHTKAISGRAASVWAKEFLRVVKREAIEDQAVGLQGAGTYVAVGYATDAWCARFAKAIQTYRELRPYKASDCADAKQRKYLESHLNTNNEEK